MTRCSVWYVHSAATPGHPTPARQSTDPVPSFRPQSCINGRCLRCRALTPFTPTLLAAVASRGRRFQLPPSAGVSHPDAKRLLASFKRLENVLKGRDAAASRMRREAELGLTRKVGSTTAMQAELPINMMRRQHFWTLPHPFGIRGTPRANLIDFDECGASPPPAAAARSVAAAHRRPAPQRS